MCGAAVIVLHPLKIDYGNDIPIHSRFGILHGALMASELHFLAGGNLINKLISKKY